MDTDKILVVVESPGKIDKISKILGNKYIVKASIGHVRNLDPTCVSVDVHKNFTPTYIIDPNKKRVVSDLRNTLKYVNYTLLAMDDDREGEAIADSLVDVLKLKNYKRILFNEITKTAILNAVKNPGEINYNVVNSQKARMILDKIVGYKVSPLLWQNIGNRLSAGRVQSVVVKLVVERENKINDFSENSYYDINAIFKQNNLKATLNKITKKQKTKFTGENAKIKKLNDCNKQLELFRSSKFKVKFIFDKKGSRNPPPPFITSSIQQEAGNKFGYTSKRIMMILQKLYEKGYITYMRTDSTKLSKEALEELEKFIVNKFGKEFLFKRDFNKKSKNAQEAHEPIRHTQFNKLKINQSNEENKMYELIVNRTIASQMCAAEICTSYLQIEIDNDDKHYFETSIERITFLGFLILYNSEVKEKPNLPKKGDGLNYEEINAIQKFTKSIGRYNEASLIKELERLGIGRPSTFANIITKILDKDYVEKKDIDGIIKEIINLYLKNDEIKETKKEITTGKEKNKLVPTEIGFTVTKYLVSNFDNIMDYRFTANLETELDEIANEKIIWYEMLDNFYKPFIEKVNSLTKSTHIVSNDFKLLGNDDDTDIYIGKSKYGNCVKSVIDEEVKFASIPDNYKLKDVSLKLAIKLLKFPFSLGKHDNKDIIINRGKYGMYLTYENKNYKLIKEVKLDDAIKIIDNTLKKEINIIKDKKISYYIKNGPYGPYISFKKGSKYKNIKIPSNIKPEDIKLKDIKVLIK
tara:strand:+ start:1741 stop:3999 length:2259 start_codon:yes stop_codon:yes gene_type:complete